MGICSLYTHYVQTSIKRKNLVNLVNNIIDNNCKCMSCRKSYIRYNKNCKDSNFVTQNKRYMEYGKGTIRLVDIKNRKETSYVQMCMRCFRHHDKCLQKHILDRYNRRISAPNRW